jgi:hypothetical protein
MKQGHEEFMCLRVVTELAQRQQLLDDFETCARM